MVSYHDSYYRAQALLSSPPLAGVNNAYLINKGSPEAMLYNDQSVLENMHLTKAFQVLADPDCNIFCNMAEVDYKHVRTLIIQMVLNTDMSLHFELMGTCIALRYGCICIQMSCVYMYIYTRTTCIHFMTSAFYHSNITPMCTRGCSHLTIAHFCFYRQVQVCGDSIGRQADGGNTAQYDHADLVHGHTLCGCVQPMQALARVLGVGQSGHA